MFKKNKQTNKQNGFHDLGLCGILSVVVICLFVFGEGW